MGANHFIFMLVLSTAVTYGVDYPLGGVQLLNIASEESEPAPLKLKARTLKP